MLRVADGSLVLQAGCAGKCFLLKVLAVACRLREGQPLLASTQVMKMIAS